MDKEMIMAVIRPTNNSSDRPSKLLPKAVQERRQAIMTTLGCRSEEFMTKVTPDTGYKFARNVEVAIMRNYPTLAEINFTYGEGTADNWLTTQLADVALFTGAKNLDKYQQTQTARLIASQYYYIKITEFLVFFQWFKGGKYGKFYGSVDPMVIMCALRDFITERNEIIGRVEQEERERRAAEERKSGISYEEYQRRKAERENNNI